MLIQSGPTLKIIILMPEIKVCPVLCGVSGVWSVRVNVITAS